MENSVRILKRKADNNAEQKNLKIRRLCEGNTTENRPSTSRTKHVQLVGPSKPAAVRLHQLECVRTLGSGGFSTVLLARRVDTLKRSKLYAVKVVPKQRTGPAYKLIEQKVMEALPYHSFVVNFIGRLDDCANAYLVLEYAPCGTFYDLIYGTKSGFTVAETRFYVANILSAIEFLHANKVVHADLKPENILVGRDGYLLLNDFGLSKFESDRDNWVGFGTTVYAAPEILCGAKTEPQTWAQKTAIDFWALGCIFFEIRTKKLAFHLDQADKRHSLLEERIRNGDGGTRGASSENRFAWGEEFCDCVESLLEVNPDRRFGTAQVKGHKFFKDFPWERLLTQELTPPQTPEPRDLMKVRHTQPLPLQSAIPGLRVSPPSRLYAYKPNQQAPR